MKNALTKDINVLGKTVPIFVIALVAMAGVGTAAVVQSVGFTSQDVDVAEPFTVSSDEIGSVTAGDTTTFGVTVENNADATQDAVYEVVTLNTDEWMEDSPVNEIEFEYELVGGSSEHYDQQKTQTAEFTMDSDNMAIHGGDLVLVIEAQEGIHGPNAEWEKDFHFDFSTFADADQDYTAEFEILSYDPLE